MNPFVKLIIEDIEKKDGITVGDMSETMAVKNQKWLLVATWSAGQP